MGKNYVLLMEDSQESQEARNLLKRKSIDFELMNIPTDGGWQLPCFQIPEGRCEGLNIIKSYIETAYSI